MANKDTIYVANTSGWVNLNNGHPELPEKLMKFEAGKTRVRSGHPILKQCPAYFDLEDDDLAPIEWPPKR